MAYFLLKEAVLLMILATVLSVPRPSLFDPEAAVATSAKTPLRDNIEEEEVYPITREYEDQETVTTSATTTLLEYNEEEEEEEEEEVYPMITPAKNVLSQARNNQVDKKHQKVLALEKSRKAFRSKRGVVMDSSKKWKKQSDGKVVINYVFDGINENSERWLRDIFRELDLKTCIHFRESATGHYVNFQKGNDGCSSYVGYIEAKSTQEVNLWSPNCDFRATAMHEVLHLLGFYHEHQRYDRDHYINVYHQNILTEPKDLNSQFNTKAQNLLPPYDAYDEHSIMHYGEYAFSKEYGVKKTMEANDGGKLGAESHMDANDVMKINEFYGCERKQYKDVKLTLKTADSFLAGTDADVYVKLKGSQGETDFELVTEGGKIANENEKGAEETHKMAFLDVGEINALKVTLVEEGSLPSKKRKRYFERGEGKTKRWFSGWTLEYAKLQFADGSSITFSGGDVYVGEVTVLTHSSKK